MMGDFSGTVVLVTGADAGFGRQIALAFGERGAMVAANALTPINLDETVALAQANGGDVKGYVADIASKLALQSMIHDIIDQYGRLDILVQAAGAVPKDALLDMDEWDWRRTVDINLTGPFLLMQSVGRLMREQGSGVIVNLVEIGEESGAGTAGKKGLLTLTRVAADELGSFGIRVNAVTCGAGEGEQLVGFPDDPTALVLFLCSEEGADVNGKVIQFEPVE